MEIPKEPKETYQEMIEEVREDGRNIPGKYHRPLFIVHISFDDLLWDANILRLKIYQRTDASYFPQGTGGLLGEMLGDALLEFVGVRGSHLLAEPRKEEIEQLPAAIKIVDPPFEPGSIVLVV